MSTALKDKGRNLVLEAEIQQLTETVVEFENKKSEDMCHIKPTEHRGKPVKDVFIGHCRTLLASGASARSVREQLLLKASFFLRGKEYEHFMAAIPSLRYFQLQREGMGNESMFYSFISIARCEEVCQWGFDETSLNGIPTLNQWCRIKEGGEYRNVTIECAGLLPGSTSTHVAEHIKVTWERGQRLMAMVRIELGEAEADAIGAAGQWWRYHDEAPRHHARYVQLCELSGEKGACVKRRCGQGNVWRRGVGKHAAA